MSALILNESRAKKILDYMLWCKAETEWGAEDRELAQLILKTFPKLKNMATETLL